MGLPKNRVGVGGGGGFTGVGVMHLLFPSFSSWEDFEYDHHDYGEGNTSTLTSIHQQLQPYLIRRIKKDVEKSLPAKV